MIILGSLDSGYWTSY